MKKPRNNKNQFIKGIHYSLKTEFKKGQPGPRKGVPKPGWTNQTSFKSRKKLWESNPREYQSVHLWIKTHGGKPNYCEICKTESPLQYHWANKTGLYLRKIEDWIRLCPSCHKEYDRRITSIERLANLIITTHYSDKLIMLVGNGGSLEMSHHFSGELLAQFERKRESIGAITLSNPAVVTAIANDFGYEYVFSRQIEGLGKKDGLLIILTTSDYDEKTGHNINLWKAAGTAFNKKKMKVAILGSNKTIRLRSYSSCFVEGKGNVTAEIQNDHLVLIHLICRKVEDILLRRKYQRSFKEKHFI